MALSGAKIFRLLLGCTVALMVVHFVVTQSIERAELEREAGDLRAEATEVRVLLGETQRKYNEALRALAGDASSCAPRTHQPAPVHHDSVGSEAVSAIVPGSHHGEPTAGTGNPAPVIQPQTTDTGVKAPHQRSGSERVVMAIWNGLPAHLFHTDFAPLNNFVRWVEGTQQVNVQLHGCPLTVECNVQDYMRKSMDAHTIVVFTHFFRVKYADRAVNHILATANNTGKLPPKIIYFLAGDEYCTNIEREFPTNVVFSCYFHKHPPERPYTFRYMPLGVGFRYPSVEQSELKTGPERRWLFNAMITLETNPARRALASLVTKINATIPKPIFLHLIAKWSKNHDKGYLSPAEYKQVLLDSLFTLVPMGHSPECYRFYEALEAGSIPVVVDNASTRKEKCGDPWMEFRETGLIIILDRWEALKQLVDQALQDPEPYFRQQQKILQEYRKVKDGLYQPMLDLVLP
mmetsp:Transcript_80542/g.141887  ORF Transcript_80542/g.141887 Transcript_80542/m.141887 type:complete len:462 (-) Transcript_80542:54-1439(-)